MHVAVADDRLAVPCGPPLRAPIEIHRAREHRVAFDRVEQRGVALGVSAETYRRRKVRVRRDDEAALTRLEAREIAERAHILRAAREVQEEHVPAFDGSFDAGDQDEASLGGV